MKKILFLLILVLAVGLIGCSQISDSQTKNSTTDKNSNVEITLNSIEIKDSLKRSESNIVYPAEDSYFVVVDITISNIGYQYKYGDTEEEKSKLYIYYTEFQLFDDESYSYKPDTILGIGLNNILPANIYINKDDKLRGRLIYELPKSSKIQDFILKGGDTSGRTDVGTIKINVEFAYKNAKSNFLSNSNGVDKQSSNLEKSENEESKDKVLTASISETKDDGELEITINNVDFLKEIGNFKAPTDKEIIIVDLTVKNIYTENKKFYSQNTYLTDEAGYSYKNEWDVEYQIENRLSSDDILPGMKSRGKLGYLIPKNAKNVKFIAKFELLGGDTLIVDLD